MAKLLLAKEVNAALNEQTANLVKALRDQGKTCSLAIVRVGEKESDLSYERSAMKRCAAMEVGCRQVTFPESAKTDEIISAIRALNADPEITGVLILKPLPRSIDEDAVTAELDPAKDVDGITGGSALGVYLNKKIGAAPCTARAAMEILHHYGIDVTGKKAVVIGRSLVIGKPVAMLLLNENATVTVCHKKTENLADICRDADIIIASAGKAEMVTADFVRPGQVIIDVGINVSDDGTMCGDVDFEAVSPIVAAITPVPGGVGGVTTSILVNTVVKNGSN